MLVKKECECPECGSEFQTPQALASHLRHRHKGRGTPSPPGETLDLKRDFVGLLRDVGVRRAAQTIADIFFGLGADSLENLDRVLRLAGVTNPARGLTLKRWGQRVGREAPKELLRGRDARERSVEEERPSDVFEAYEKVREAELTELLMEDLRTRIKERRRKVGGEDGSRALLDKLERLEDEISDLRFSQNLSRASEPWPPYHQPPSPRPQAGARAYLCYNPYHLQPCAVCGICGLHGSIMFVPIGTTFTCTRCGAAYFRDR